MTPTRVSSSRSADRRFLEGLGVSRVRRFEPVPECADLAAIERPAACPIEALKYMMPTVADTKEGRPAE